MTQKTEAQSPDLKQTKVQVSSSWKHSDGCFMHWILYETRCCSLFRNRKAYFYQSLLRDKHCPCFTNCSPVEFMFFFALTDISPSEDQVHRWPNISFLHHLLLTQIYFGIMSPATGAGSFCWWRQFFFLHMVFWACMPAGYTSRECALMWVCAVYHDGECSIASVMLVERGH